MTPETDSLRDLVAEVAAAYFSNSHVGPSEIPTVIQQIAHSLAAVATPGGAVVGDPAVRETTIEGPPPTAAQIRASIKPDALISFEDGKRYRTLKRHLASRGLTPEQYRRKWGLGADYPMVCVSYSKSRSDLAKARGLGRKAPPAPVAPVRGSRKRAG